MWLFIILLPLLSLYSDIIFRIFQYNFYSTPADIIFKHQDYFLYLLEENKKLQEQQPYSPKKNEDSYTPLVKNDLSKIIHFEQNNRNNLELNGNSYGTRTNQIHFDQSEYTSVQKMKSSDYLVENILNDKLQDFQKDAHPL
jgi:hypothetical protein